MKYIRTKDGRILKVFCEKMSCMEENDSLTYYGKNTVDFETSLFLGRMEVIKEADTIEELCDEFVAIDIGVFGDKTKSYKTIKEVKEDKTFLFDILYGAIWTDKGIIYVAKMNEKGELELL